MKIKQIAEDFKVDEIYDLKSFEKKSEDKEYHYFILTKKDYNQIKAIDIVARAFNTNRKFVNYAGTKDKTGITSQVISILLKNNSTLDENLEYFNSNHEDLNLEYIGKFNGRINLGDNLGNKFTIIVRDLNEKNIEIAKVNLNKCEKEGILNYFDSQRFGFANNSHTIGNYVLNNKIEEAVYEILTSIPKQNPSEELINFGKFINEKRVEIKEQNIEVIEKAIELIPEKFIRDYEPILKHLLKAKNDFPGAFRTLPKKLRTLYVNAYQSDLFNKEIENTNKTKLELFDISPMLTHMPELKPKNKVSREVRVFPKNLKIGETREDNLNENKLMVTISFELGSGEYATNVVKQLFEN